MSFPVAVPDRRLLRRRRCDAACIIHYGVGKSTSATLHQLDVHGARLSLAGADDAITGDIRIVTDTGSETYGAVAWRCGAVIGVRRHAHTAALTRSSRSER